jgi:hypothetical protein
MARQIKDLSTKTTTRERFNAVWQILWVKAGLEYLLIFTI